MDKKKTPIFIDTNIFIIDLRYKRDKNFKINKKFLNFIALNKNGFTSIINLLEVCGILSFNLNAQQIYELYSYLPKRYNVEIMPHHSLELPLPQFVGEKIFEYITRKLAFGDALIISIFECTFFMPSYFISWDAQHFKDKTNRTVLTPKEFLEH